MQSLQSIGSVSWLSHYWSRNHFADLLNCETLVDGDTNQHTEIAFWKTWDAPVIKGITWSGLLSKCCVGGYMYIWNLCKTVALQIGLLESSKGKWSGNDEISRCSWKQLQCVTMVVKYLLMSLTKVSYAQIFLSQRAEGINVFNRLFCDP